MDIREVGVQSYSSYSTTTDKSDKSSSDSKKTSNSTNNLNNDAVIYESSVKSSNKPDTATIERLKAEAEKRTSQFRDLVQKLLLKQGQKFDESTNIYHLLREGKVQVDPETRVQAQKDIEPGGYWSVEATSDRLVEFAKAAAGNDPEKAEAMIGAIKKGFEQAKKAWGGELPKISHDTLDATIKKLDNWKSGVAKEDKK